MKFFIYHVSQNLASHLKKGAHFLVARLVRLWKEQDETDYVKTDEEQGDLGS